MATPAPVSVADVEEQLRRVGAGLPEHDGVRWFNELYLYVTQRVGELLEHDGFEDPTFLERLDTVFAELYLRALDTQATAAWTPLLTARADQHIAPDRFMLAGVNAHVNYDLPIALATTCQEVGGQLAPDTPRHRDFQRIDDLLAEAEDTMHRRLHTNHVKEVVALWGVVRARDRAWNAALHLAALPSETQSTTDFLNQLGGVVNSWGELLLHLPG